MSTTTDRITKIINDDFCPSSDVKPESALQADLGFDSLDEIQLVMEMEEEFGIQIPDDDALACKTVADVVALVDRLAGAAA